MIHFKKKIAFQNVTPTDRVENVQNLTVINTIYHVLMMPFKTGLNRHSDNPLLHAHTH